MDCRLFALLLLCTRWELLAGSGNTDAPADPSHMSADGEEEGDCDSRQYGQEVKRAVGAAVMKTGLRLLGQLTTGPEQPNLIISPLSISLALSQLALGARNNTAILLLNSLHANTVPCYHWALRELIQHLGGHALQVASRMYLKPGFELKQAFVDESLRIYASEPAPLVGLQEVNQWVENATQGRVTRFLSSLPVSVVLMLVNAVHFKGEWQARFDPNLTSKDLFYIDNMNAVHVDMMLGSKYPLSVLVDRELGAQVARFPFREEMSLLVVMPMSDELNISAMASQLDPSDLYDRLPRETSMRVKLPKFKLEYSQDLQDALTGIGLGQLFSAPDLSGIADGFLRVSSVQHKSSLELHEEGAEAAAATAVIVSRSNPTFAVNQPFIFALMDDSTRTPLFLGVVTNPNPGAPVITMLADRPDNVTLPLDKEFGGVLFSRPK